MLSKNEIQYIKEYLPYEKAPILSLYLDTHPTRVENQGKGHYIRAKNALKELGVPKEVAERVLAYLEEPPKQRTTAIFASEEVFQVFGFHVDLPLVGGFLAHWGEPFVAPILFALEEYEPAGVAYIDRERWRFFRVQLGEIEEVHDAFLALDTTPWREFTVSATGRRYHAGRASGGAGMDLFKDRLEAWLVRFYKQVAKLLDQAMTEAQARCLILMGPEAPVRHFEGFLPPHLAQKVAVRLPSLPNPGATPGQVLKAVEPVLAEVERREEEALLGRLEEKGVFGPEALDLLQEGRVDLLVLPWDPEGRVYVGERVALSPEAAGGASPEEKPLVLVLPGLAEAYATRLEFLHGEPQRRLKERGGMAALLRW